MKPGIYFSLHSFQCIWLAVIFCGLGYLVFPTHGITQSSPGQLWYTYNHQARISKHWGYQFDLNYRTTAFDGMEPVISAARVGIGYFPNEKLRLSGGYAWFGAYPEKRSEQLLEENRGWQQAVWNYTSKRTNYFHRIRLEERFRQMSLSANKTETHYTTRLRYLFQWQGILIKSKHTNGFAVKWQVADEIMLHAGEQVKQHYFEQNRAICGIVLAPSSTIELALLYQYSLQYLPVPERMQQLHTLRLTLLHALDFRSKEK